MELFHIVVNDFHSWVLVITGPVVSRTQCILVPTSQFSLSCILWNGNVWVRNDSTVQTFPVCFLYSRSCEGVFSCTWDGLACKPQSASGESGSFLYEFYRSGTVNSNTVNSKFHLIRSYCEIFFYHIPNISCLKCTVNSNFHLIRSKTLLTNDFELTVPNLYFSPW